MKPALFKGIILFLFFFILSGCANKQVDINSTKLAANLSKSEKYDCQDLAKVAYVKVEGVECKFCAQTVLNEISKINGIVSAEYENRNEDYDNNRIKLVYNNKVEIVKNEISKILTDEGFDLKSIESA